MVENEKKVSLFESDEGLECVDEFGEIVKRCLVENEKKLSLIENDGGLEPEAVGKLNVLKESGSQQPVHYSLLSGRALVWLFGILIVRAVLTSGTENSVTHHTQILCREEKVCAVGVEGFSFKEEGVKIIQEKVIFQGPIDVGSGLPIVDLEIVYPGELEVSTNGEERRDKKEGKHLPSERSKSMMERSGEDEKEMKLESKRLTIPNSEEDEPKSLMNYHSIGNWEVGTAKEVKFISILLMVYEDWPSPPILVRYHSGEGESEGNRSVMMMEFEKWKEKLPQQQRKGVGMIMKNEKSEKKKFEILLLKPMIGCAEWQVQEGMKSEGLCEGTHYGIPFKQLTNVYMDERSEKDEMDEMKRSEIEKTILEMVDNKKPVVGQESNPLVRERQISGVDMDEMNEMNEDEFVWDDEEGNDGLRKENEVIIIDGEEEKKKKNKEKILNDERMTRTKKSRKQEKEGIEERGREQEEGRVVEE